MALLKPRPTSAPATQPRLRRCTYRRIAIARTARELPVYDVACLYPDRDAPVPLGDLASAMSICESCEARGIFRADED